MKTIQLPLADGKKKQATASVATEGARRATGVDPEAGGGDIVLPLPPDPEVTEAQPRRRFTAPYKLRVLAEADACTQPGEIGELLRREGLYSSNLTAWRRQREQGVLNALSPQKRGRKAKGRNPLAHQVARLEKENRRLQQKLKQAELIMEAQKKMSEILGIARDLDESDEKR